VKKLLEFERVQRIIIELKKNMIKTAIPVENLVFHSETGTKEFERGAYFGEKNQYYTIAGELCLPNEFQNQTVDLAIFSSLTEWDSTTNPQNMPQEIGFHCKSRFFQVGRKKNIL